MRTILVSVFGQKEIVGSDYGGYIIINDTACITWAKVSNLFKFVLF